MKNFTAKVDFSKLFYDPADFAVSNKLFKNGDSYISYAENWEYIIIDECIFCKFSGGGCIEFIYDFFYTARELRKLKLERINENVQ